MEIRKKAIQSHLKSLSISKNLIEECTHIGLECSKEFTRLTKVCSGVGLLIASKSRGMSYTLKQVSQMLNIKSKTLFKYYSKMNCRPCAQPLKKIPKLEDMLEDCQAEPEIREKAYSLMKNKQCKTVFQAVKTAYSNPAGFLLAQQQNNLLPAKLNKNQNLENSTLRLENLIVGRPLELDSFPCISVLDIEKEILTKALDISYNQYVINI